MCHTGYADCLLASSQHNLYDIYLLLCIQYYTPDDGQKTCPKHVESYSKDKFEKLVHLVGFIIRIYCHLYLSNGVLQRLQILLRISTAKTSMDSQSATERTGISVIFVTTWQPYIRVLYSQHRAVLTLRRLTSYIYGAPILDVSRSHTTTQHSR